MRYRNALPGLTLLAALLAASCSEARVLASWDFTRPNSGWKDEAGSVPQISPQGTLWPGAAAGVSLRSPALTIPTEAFQALELSLSLEQPGQAHLLWQGEAFGRSQSGWQGPLPLTAPADGHIHELRLLPFWQNVRTIESLRLVAPPGTRLRLKSIRLVTPDLPPGDHVSWDLTSPVQAGQWSAVNLAAALEVSPEGLRVRLNQPSALLLSPPLDLPTFQYEWLSARLTARSEARVKLQWACSGMRGLHGPDLRLQPGTHTYNVRCGTEKSWAGQLRGLALELGALPRTEVTIQAITLGNEPQGAPDLRTVYAGPLEPRVRAGQTFRLIWALRNEGGQQARSVKVVALPAEGVIIPEGPLAVPRMDHGTPEVLSWLVKADAPATVVLQAEYDGRLLREEVRLPVEPAAPSLPQGKLPPVTPASLSGAVVTAHYHTPPPPQHGAPALDRALLRRPFLGDYAATPGCVDWQIKWSLEHGLTGWIMNVGTEHENATLDAFLSARLSRQMQFALCWSAPVPSAPEGLELFGARLAPVLASPNYLRVQGKPVVLVAHALRRTGDGWGLSDLKELSDKLPVALVACAPLDAASLDLLGKAGYTAAVDLHTDEAFPRTASPLEDWEQAAAAGTPHLLSLQSAWRGGMTPERFQTLLKVALLRARRADTCALPIVLAGDFNAEQSLEPRRPEGFLWLRALAQSLGVTPPAEVLPQDVGLGPFDREPVSAQCAWEFDSKESWTSAMGLSVLRVTDGKLTGRTDSTEPALFGGDTTLDTRHYRAIIIGMSSSAGDSGRLYWKTSLRKFTRDNSLPFTLNADGAIHEYRLEVAQTPGWRGYLEGLRLDPTNAAGAAVAVDYIRVVP